VDPNSSAEVIAKQYAATFFLDLNIREHYEENEPCCCHFPGREQKA